MTVWQDVRIASRKLVQDPWFTLVVVLTLGLGIAVNNTVFTLVNAVLIRGLPFDEPDRLMYLSTRQTEPGRDLGVSYPDFRDWQAGTRTFVDLGAFTGGTMNVSDAGQPPERRSGARVTANTFRLLRQRPLVGRDFAPDEDRPGAEPVVILGHDLWTTRYGADPGVLGRVIKVNEIASTIVGVMPAGMKFPTNADLWQPLVPTADRERRDRRTLSVFGRLRAGAARGEGQAELSAIAAGLAAQYPDTNQGIDAVVMTFNERFNGGPIRLVFLALLGAVGFVLLIACANVANLLLARATHRAREAAVRVSLGATRWRIVRQLLIESVLLGVVSGAAGLLLSVVGVRLFARAVEDVGKPYWIEFTMDARVFAYLALICIASAVVFGLAPALQVSRAGVNELLKEGGRAGGAGRRAQRLSGTMVTAELVLTIVLLASAGLMIRSFLALYRLDLGFETRRLLTMRLVLPERKYPAAADWVAFHERLGERLENTAGVDAAAMASTLPLSGGDRQQLEIDGRPAPAGEPAPEVSVVTIGRGYFETLGLTLRGRAFTTADGHPGAEAAIVNERFVARFLPGEDPVGRRIRLKEDAGADGPWLTIRGVSPTVRQRAFQERDPDPVVYVPFRQEPARVFTILLRSRGDPAVLSGAAREAVRAIDPDLPVYAVLTMDEALAQARWPFRVFGSLFAIFALIALVLSAVGIYAVTACAVTQRTQEIGVRMALGAQTGQVSWLILRRGLVQLAAGLTLGLPGALGVGRVLESLLVQTSPSDPATLAGVTALLAGVTVAACLLPAQRAARLDPVAALRSE